MTDIKSNSPVSLVYCGNSGVFDGLIISLLSICNHTGRPLHVHVLTMDLTRVSDRFTPLDASRADFLRQMLQSKNADSRLTLYDLSDEFWSVMSDSPNMNTSYTPYTLLRLFCDLLPLPDRVLYLDTDTVAAGDIGPLFDWDMQDCDYAAVRDYLGGKFIGPSYVNAGVLLFDLSRIRKSGLLEKARRFCAEKKTFFPDQDAINRLGKDKCMLPRSFNEQYKMQPDTVIRHFSKTIRWFPFFHTLNIKPWDIDGLHRVYGTYEFDEVLAEYSELKKRFESVGMLEGGDGQ